MAKRKQAGRELIEKKFELKTKNSSFKIKKAIQYIKENYRKPRFSSRKVAYALKMHPKAFSRLWREKMRIAFKDFINKLKIEDAKVMLRKTNLYVSQIAVEVGLPPKHFSRIFTLHAGISPAKYRNYKQKK